MLIFFAGLSESKPGHIYSSIEHMAAECVTSFNDFRGYESGNLRAAVAIRFQVLRLRIITFRGR